MRLRRYSGGRELERGVLTDALRSAPTALLIVDSFDRICFASDAAAQMLGREADALRQDFLHDHLVTRESDTEHVGDTAPALRGGAVNDTAPALRGGAVNDTAPALRGGAVNDTAPALRGGAVNDTAPALRGGAVNDTAPALRGGAVNDTAPALRGGAVNDTAPALRGGAVNDTAPALRGGASLTAVARTALGPCTLAITLADGRRARAKMNGLCDHWGDVAHACVVLEADVTAPPDAFDSLGRLAGELAHDVNNQLSAALNYVFILRRRLTAIEPLANHLEELQAAVWRASGLASTLKVVGRKRNPEPESLALGDVVRGLTPLLHHFARDVRVEIDCTADLPALHAPLAYTEQVVVLVALLQLGRAPTDSVLRLSARCVQKPSSITPNARLVIELVGDREPAPGRSSANGHSTHSGLRRALKRCHARMGHDARSVWIDFG